ncbi:hypothetical protein AB205_0187670, partial [Aquarana catesbeiana]
QIVHIPKYHATHETPLWVALELIDCDPFSITNLIWSNFSDRKTINIIIKHTVAIWDKFKIVNGLQSPHVPLLLFIRNPLFYPACSVPKSFKDWTSFILTQICELTPPTSFKTFPELCEKHKLPQSELFQYLQSKERKSNLDKVTSFERICKCDPHSKGLITLIHNHLITLPNIESPSYVAKWERDLGFQLEATGWDKTWATTKSSSQNITALETNY